MLQILPQVIIELGIRHEKMFILRLGISGKKVLAEKDTINGDI
jgi:hypothetical protein